MSLFRVLLIRRQSNDGPEHTAASGGAPLWQLSATRDSSPQQQRCWSGWKHGSRQMSLTGRDPLNSSHRRAASAKWHSVTIRQPPLQRGAEAHQSLAYGPPLQQPPESRRVQCVRLLSLTTRVSHDQRRTGCTLLVSEPVSVHQPTVLETVLELGERQRDEVSCDERFYRCTRRVGGTRSLEWCRGGEVRSREYNWTKGNRVAHGERGARRSFEAASRPDSPLCVREQGITHSLRDWE